jgi:hypothetical protein
MELQINKKDMKKLMVIALMLIASNLFSQALQSDKVVIVNDSILQMGLTNGRSMQVIAAPGSGKSVVIQSIDIRNKVLNRLYSATEGASNYLIGYQQGELWYTISTVPFDRLNSKGNTTFFWNVPQPQKLWEESMTDNAPVMIKFSTPMNFTAGNNRLTLYITYRILN